jgi:hypothetical protein
MREFIRGLPLLGFLGLAVIVAAAATVGSERIRRRAINTFLVYTLAVSFGAGLLQRELWPFSTWPLVAGFQPGYAQLSRLVVVDSTGQEHNVDYRAWRPLVIEELLAWTEGRMLSLDRRTQDAAAEHLLQLAERGIERVRSGDSPGHAGFLGRFSAPSFLLHPALWHTAADLPSELLVGLRLYDERWDLEERLRDPAALQRILRFDYRRP